jgi:putative ABC transport system permease protein
MMVGAGMTIFLSCIGLFGLTVMTAERRTKEMGIRKILGASVANAVAILTSGFVKLVMISLIIALPAAWVAVDTWLLNYPYHISLNWTIFATGAMLMLLISLVTVSFQALKTALANPVDSLRIE